MFVPSNHLCVRVIDTPKPRLLEARRRLLRLLVSRILAHPTAKGFIPWPSTSDFAPPLREGNGTACRPSPLL